MTPLRNVRTLCLNMPCLHNRYDTCSLKSNDGVKMLFPQIGNEEKHRDESCEKCDYYENVGGF